LTRQRKKCGWPKTRGTRAIHRGWCRSIPKTTRWRNRAEFPVGRAQVKEFLERKWARELDYRLIKELWAFTGNRIAVRFAYEWHDDSGHWFRSYGNENWEFNEQGLMVRRFASINDLPISAADRKMHWPLGRRPDDHASLSELGL
jgi:nuclear transport factor 2 (NTF2) superfamily protein